MQSKTCNIDQTNGNLISQVQFDLIFCQKRAEQIELASVTMKWVYFPAGG